MEEIKFGREKRGYSVEQVDSYVTMLQNHYQELEQKREEYQGIAAQLQKQSQQQKQKQVQSGKRVEEKQEQLQALEEEIQSRRQELKNLENINEQTGQEVHRLKDQWEALKHETQLKQAPPDEGELQELLILEAKLAAAKEQSEKLQLEKEWLAKTVEEVSREMELLETKASGSQEKEGADDLEKLQVIFVKARQKANLLVEEIKQQTQQEVDEIKQECHRLIAGANEAAELIRAEIRKEQAQEAEEERVKVEARERTFRQEKEEALAVCDKIRQDAEQKKLAALEQAGQIEEETQRSLNAVEQKEKMVEERVLRMINQKKGEIAEGFQMIESELTDTVKEIQDMMKEIR